MRARAPRSVLVVGCGSTIRSDDGVGRRVVEALGPFCAGIDVISVHQLDFDLAEKLHAHDVVVFVDAAADQPAGSVRCRALQAEPGSVLLHHLTPEALLAVARRLRGSAPAAWAITIGGAEFGLGESLSAAITSRFEAIVSAVASAALGLSVGAGHPPGRITGGAVSRPSGRRRARTASSLRSAGGASRGPSPRPE